MLRINIYIASNFKLPLFETESTMIKVLIHLWPRLLAYQLGGHWV